MVEIRRSGLNNRRKPFGGTRSANGFNGGRSSSSSGSTLGMIIRIVVVAAVVIQGVRVFRSSSTISVPSEPAKGLEDRLSESKPNSQAHGNIRKQPQQQPIVKPPPQVAVHDVDHDGDDEVHHDAGGNDSENTSNDEKRDNKSKADNSNDTQQDGDEVEDGTNGITTSGAKKNPIVVEKKGTGPTNVGYVKDFVNERSNPVYRTQKVELKDVSDQVAKLVHEASVTPCETVEQAGESSSSSSVTVKTNPKCLDSDTPLIAYNPEKFPRSWCGQDIAPGTAVTMTEQCTDPIVHLFSSTDDAMIPPVSGDHMPPIILKSKPHSSLKDLSLESVDCDIPCRIEKDFKVGSGDMYVDGEESWTVTATMADGWYDAFAKIERTDFMKDHYYATQSLKSDVPLTYYDAGLYSLRGRTIIDFDTAKPAAIYLADTNCSAQATKRGKYYGAMKEAMTVDSYASCGHNKDVPDGISLDNLDDRLTLMRQYRIILAIDTATSKDHISPIVWEAMISGSVPVIVGADNIRDHLPKKSFINKSDFSTWGELAQYALKVANDKDLWMSYQSWRNNEEEIAAIEAKFEFSKTSPTCRLCRWSYAKKYGLGWDHQMQRVRDISKVPKEVFCSSNTHGLVSKPFSEEWQIKNGDEESTLKEDSDDQSCSSSTANGDVEIGSFSGHRRVVHHDGVTDMIISNIKNDSSEGSTVLKLNFQGVRNPDGASFMDTHTKVSSTKGPLVSSITIQDDLVKVSVLADWNTPMMSMGEGVIGVTITGNESNQPRRIRIIMEEMNAVHDKLTEFYASSFYQRMAKDFIDPLSIFFADS